MTLLAAQAEEQGRRISDFPCDVSTQSVPNNNTVLTFSDDFKAGWVDPSKWNTWVPWPVIINGELGAYVPNAFEFLPNVGIRIRADRRKILQQDYTTGELASFGKFSHAYGYFEMEARVPKGKGFWPAFWIMPFESGTNGAAEIDVMEILCQDPYTVHTTLHYLGMVSGRNLGLGESSGGSDFSEGFHKFAVSWRPSVLVWLVDGVEKFRIEGNMVPSTPEYIIANLAIGGSWPLPPDATTRFSAYMDIKSVHVYQYKDLKDALISTPPVTFGAAAVTPGVVKPGEGIDIRSSYRTDKPYPSVLARVYVTDFYGKKYLSEMDQTFRDVRPGSVNTVKVRWTVPGDFPAGIYTVAIKLNSGDPKVESFLGCATRFEVSPAGVAYLK